MCSYVCLNICASSNDLRILAIVTVLNLTLPRETRAGIRVPELPIIFCSVSNLPGAISCRMYRHEADRFLHSRDASSKYIGDLVQISASVFLFAYCPYW